MAPEFGRAHWRSLNQQASATGYPEESASVAMPCLQLSKRREELTCKRLDLL